MDQFIQDERGTAAIEYSLFISLIGMVIVGAVHALGGNVSNAFSFIDGSLTSVQVSEGAGKIQ